jgi:glycerol uptake facilitator-like aquaporin
MGIIVASMKALVAEFVAMVLFVWIGTGSAVSSNFFAEGDGVEPA